MRIFAVTLAFAPSRILLTCMDQVSRTIGPMAAFQHHALNQHYPAWNELQNDVMVEKICRTYGIQIHDVGRNIGLAKGYNMLVKDCGAKEGDIIIGIDPDTFPVTPGWGAALVDVAQHPKIGWASLTFPVVDAEMGARGFDRDIINGREVLMPHQTCMSSICAFRYEVWRDMGGFHEPKEFYGGAEGVINQRLVNMGLRWAYLPGFREEASELVRSEDAYRDYKWEYAHKNSTQLDFASWRKEKGV